MKSATGPGMAFKPKPTKGIVAKIAWKIGFNLIESSHNEYMRVMLSLLEQNPSAKLLDLGCFDGGFTTRVMEAVGTIKVVGIDKHNFGFPYEFSQLDLENGIPLLGNYFDVVMVSHVIEHLANTDLLVKDTYRVLRPGGYAIISTDNLASWHNIFYLLLGKQPEPIAVSDELFGPYDHDTHKRLFTSTGLVRLLRHHGFRIEKVIGSGMYPLPIPLARVLCKVDKRHPVNITVKVRKELGESTK